MAAPLLLLAILLGQVHQGLECPGLNALNGDRIYLLEGQYLRHVSTAINSRGATSGRLIYLCLLVRLTTICFVACTTKRTVYTLFTEPKTWNEAHDICESQFGQLFKAKSQSDIDEVIYLDSYYWNYTLSSTLANGSVWSGLHKPFTGNTSLVYQDCEPESGDIPISDTGGKCTVFQTSDFDLVTTSCNETNIYICERFEGDCWYEPFTDLKPSIIDKWVVKLPGTEATECAYECRSTNISDRQCWAFQYDQNQTTFGCILYYINDSLAQSNAGTSASVLYVIPSTLELNDTILYVRRCFEGVLDSVVYNKFVDNDASPDTICTTETYPGDAADDVICYCSVNEKPPIPEPLSAEEKALKYVRELLMDSDNTSAALRKLISAEDNRPSAVSIGYVGIAFMTIIFGGVFLLDLNTIVSEIKKIFTNDPEPPGNNPKNTEQQQQPPPPHSHC